MRLGFKWGQGMGGGFEGIPGTRNSTRKGPCGGRQLWLVVGNASGLGHKTGKDITGALSDKFRRLVCIWWSMCST